MENLLEVKKLCKDYDSFSIKDVTFSLPKGFIMGFVGQNGAGKTTTIRTILNMANIGSGEIKLLGMDSVTDSHKIKQKIGVVFDDIFFAEHLNVKEIEAQLRCFYDEWDSKTFFSYIEKFKLPLKKNCGSFSRGMKMKLSISAALSHNAQLLILDEPTSGLDPVARDELLDILAEYIADENRGILFSTHITADLERIADYVTVLIAGKVWFTGTKDELLEKYVIIKGNEKDISKELIGKSIGYHNYKNGFEAMLPVEYKNEISDKIVCEKVSIDEMLIFIAKETNS